ncbi:MAG: transposase [Saprospiraceae bacterium]|nr:transposase [Saprospiraceae bacterium]
MSHGGQMYDLLFKAALKALSIVVKQRYNKDVMPAMIAVLQLGQNLSLHPHLHCIIPSGVFDNKQGKWLTLEILAYCVRLKN